MRLEEEISQSQFASEYQKAFVNLIYTNNWLINLHSTDLKPHKITMQQYNILRILREAHPKPVTIKLIRSQMLDKMSDASRIVEKLRLKEFADRKVNADDRRNVDVNITDKGLHLLSRLEHIEKVNQQRLSRLNQTDIVHLNQLLDRLRE